MEIRFSYLIESLSKNMCENSGRVSFWVNLAKVFYRKGFRFLKRDNIWMACLWVTLGICKSWVQEVWEYCWKVEWVNDCLILNG